MGFLNLRYCGIVALLCLFVLTNRAAAQDVVMIAHKHVTASLRTEDVQQIFLGKKTRWDDETPITFALLTEKDAYADFLKEYLKKTSSQFVNYWKKQVFTGKGRMPKSFADDQALLDFVATTEGAIGFARMQDVDLSRVNVLAITN